MRQTHVIAILAALAAVSTGLGCKIGSQAAPSLTGPSEMSLAITMTASPDILTQDGASQAQVVILARNAQGAPVAGLPLQLAAANGALSAAQATTGADGRASVQFTSPSAPRTASEVLKSVVIYAAPLGTDANGLVPRSVTIVLVPPAVMPKAVIAYSPSSPLAGGNVNFDATGSSVAVGSIVGYAWDFGDGSTGTGALITHRFAPSPTPYTVLLTVIDDRGYSWATAASVAVTGTGFVPQFTFSPSDPSGSQAVYFDGTGTTGPNTVTTYAWDFGDGTTGSGSTVSHSFAGCTGAGSAQAQTFVIKLTATDVAGQTASTSQSLTVKLCR